MTSPGSSLAWRGSSAGTPARATAASGISCGGSRSGGACGRAPPCERGAGARHRAGGPDSAGWNGSRTRHGPPGVRRRGRRLSDDSRLFVSSPGSEVSLGQLLQHGDVQGEVGYQLLQAQVLLLELFQTTELRGLHAPVEVLPAVVGLLGDSDLLADLTDGAAGGQVGFGVPEVPDDLLR